MGQCCDPPACAPLDTWLPAAEYVCSELAVARADYARRAGTACFAPHFSLKNDPASVFAHREVGPPSMRPRPARSHGSALSAISALAASGAIDAMPTRADHPIARYRCACALSSSIQLPEERAPRVSPRSRYRPNAAKRSPAGSPVTARGTGRGRWSWLAVASSSSQRCAVLEPHESLYAADHPGRLEQSTSIRQVETGSRSESRSLGTRSERRLPHLGDPAW